MATKTAERYWTTQVGWSVASRCVYAHQSYQNLQKHAAFFVAVGRSLGSSSVRFSSTHWTFLTRASKLEGCWFALRRCVGARCQVVECLSTPCQFCALLSYTLAVHDLVTLVDGLVITRNILYKRKMDQGTTSYAIMSTNTTS